MIYLEIFFWLCAACVLYTYLLYPLLLALWPRFRPTGGRRGPTGAALAVDHPRRPQRGRTASNAASTN